MKLFEKGKFSVYTIAKIVNPELFVAPAKYYKDEKGVVHIDADPANGIIEMPIKDGLHICVPGMAIGKVKLNEDGNAVVYETIENRTMDELVNTEDWNDFNYCWAAAVRYVADANGLYEYERFKYE